MHRVWIIIGLFFTGVGCAGLVLPLVPGTPFLLLAAYAFSRSSPRLLAWLTGLPRIGCAISDYRAGLGIPLRVKLAAASMATAAVSASAIMADSSLARVGVVTLGAIGVWYVLARVPTRASVSGY